MVEENNYIKDKAKRWYKAIYENHPDKKNMYALIKKMRNEEMRGLMLDYVTLSERIITKSLELVIISQANANAYKMLWETEGNGANEATIKKWISVKAKKMIYEDFTK